MRLTILSLLLCAAGTTAVYANSAAVEQDDAGSDAGYSVLVQSVDHDRYFDVAVDGQNGIAVGDVGSVAITTDGGKTWTREKAATDLALLGVSIEGDRAIAVGQTGLILLRSPDGQWQVVDSGTTERLLQVDQNSKGLAVAVGAFGTLLRSTDGGKTWHKAQVDWAEIFGADEAAGASGAAGEPQLYAVQVDDDGTVTLAGEISYIVQSKDAGEHWTVTNRSAADTAGVIPPTLFSLHIGGDGEGYAVGQSGLVLKTSDGGQSWARLESPVAANLLAVTQTRTGKVTAVGMRVAIQSDNGGASWNVLDGLDLETEWYSGIAAFEGGDKGIAVGHAGRVIQIP